MACEILKYLENNILIFDGAMGTMLQAAGLPTGGLPELYNLTNPDVVKDIHTSYVKAGADIITANTFQANEFKLRGCGHSVEEVISAGIELAKSSGAKYVALDIGPLGQMMHPMGTLGFETAYDAFARQIITGARSGADLILIETMSDLLEVKAAVLAARENCDLPVFVSMTYQSDGRTFVGCDPKTEAIALSALKVDALGVNCSLGPKELTPIVDELLEYSSVPVLVQPNAGLPQLNGGKTCYDISADEYSDYMINLVKKGAAILGGCCGTTPEYIKALCDKLTNKTRVKTTPRPICALTSGTKTVELDNKISVIGERINPTGKKLLKEKLRNRDFAYLMEEAVRQSDAGADILDVNCGLPDVDEKYLLRRAVEEIQSVVNLPLQIDSSDPDAIEAAVRIYRGKPIINSVCGKADSMEMIFPIAAKYGAAVVALTLDEGGIPQTAEGRLKIAENIVKTAAGYGIPPQDIIVDCLVLTASAQQELVKETIKAVALVKERLGIKTVLGVSNVSFGLPCRPKLNSVFLSACFGAGLDCAIINPMSAEVMDAVRAFRVLNNTDKDATEYISCYSNTDVAPSLNHSADKDLKSLIEKGLRDDAVTKTKALLASGTDPMDIIENYYIPALDAVGKSYEKGVIFLPQLMQAAEAAKGGFELLRDKTSSDREIITRGQILLATVEGDIHDIGKNIAKMLLENYGYDVIDLGRSVPAEQIVEVALSNNIKLIGLSALMTTTVSSMKATIEKLKAAGCPAKIMVGGAVLSEEYAEFVGADYYVADARADVEIANKIFGF